jgi:hypothetical protein
MQTNGINDMVMLVDFFKAIEQDPRINSRHVSVYTTLFQFWIRNGHKNPLTLFGKDVMGICKISASSTYHKSIRELDAFGYIQYEPSFDHSRASCICIISIATQKITNRKYQNHFARNQQKYTRAEY